MVKPLVMLVLLVFGSVQLFSHGAFSSPTPESSSGQVNREECIRQVAHYLAQIEIVPEVKSQVDDARQDYHKNGRKNRPRQIYDPRVCRELHEAVKSIETQIPCYYDIDIMGVDELDNIKEVIKADEAAKYVIEAEYACFNRRDAGVIMRRDNLFEAITGQQS